MTTSDSRPKSTGKYCSLTNEEYLRYITNQDYTVIEEELIFRLQALLENPKIPDTLSVEFCQEVLESMDLPDIIDFINRKREG